MSCAVKLHQLIASSLQITCINLLTTAISSLPSDDHFLFYAILPPSLFTSLFLNKFCTVYRHLNTPAVDLLISGVLTVSLTVTRALA